MNRRNTNPEQTLWFIGGHALQLWRRNSQTQSSPAEQQQGGSTRGLFQRLRDRLTNRRALVNHVSGPSSPSARASCLTPAEAEAFAVASIGLGLAAKADTDSHWSFPENGIIRHPSRDTFGTAPSGPLPSCLTPARATCLTRAEAESFAHLRATAGIDVPAKTDTDSHWCFPDNGIIRHPSRDTLRTAPSGPLTPCPVSTAPSEGLEFIQPIPIHALNDPQALRHLSRWY